MIRRCLCVTLWLLARAPIAAAGEAPEPVTGLLGAMGSEVRLLLEELEGTQERTIEGIRFWTGRLRGRRVAIAMTGVGKVNAAITTTLLYQHFRPAEVVFTGIAGGLNPELKPGDIVIATKTAQHDFGTLYSDGFLRKGRVRGRYERPRAGAVTASRETLLYMWVAIAVVAIVGVAYMLYRQSL